MKRPNLYYIVAMICAIVTILITAIRIFHGDGYKSIATSSANVCFMVAFLFLARKNQTACKQQSA